jgi:phosphoribosylformimino-5-aminoimidazole carboxamide ribotide isomerase
MTDLYPAVDVLGGKAVRLTQGDYSRKTEYDSDPLEAARRWVDAGARRLHLVDLDGARDGRPVNLAHLRRIVEQLDVPVQYGGGLRSAPDVEAALEAGAARIVLGTAAFLDDELLTDMLSEHGERIAVGLDVRSGQVAIHGWQEHVQLTPARAMEHLVERGVKTIVYTTIDADGMMQGPDIGAAGDLLRAANGASVIYSGGIGSLEDIRAIAALDIEGVIVGKALYEHRFTVQQALEAL